MSAETYLESVLDQRNQTFSLARLNKGVISPTDLDAGDFTFYENGRLQSLNDSFEGLTSIMPTR
jgi:hypothetical protein